MADGVRRFNEDEVEVTHRNLVGGARYVLGLSTAEWNDLSREERIYAFQRCSREFSEQLWEFIEEDYR